MNHRLENSQNGRRYTVSYEKGAVLLFLIIVFAATFFIGKVRIYSDTESYLVMSPPREPGYSLLLNAFVVPFGEFGYTMLGFFQNVFAVCSIYCFSCYIASKYQGKYVMPVTAFCMVFPYIMTPLFATSGIILPNAMISEGVTLPLYHLFFLFLLKAVWEKQQWKYLLIALVLSFLLVMTRGQMLVTLIGWLVVAVVLNRKKGQRKKIVVSVLLFVLALGCRTVCTNSYQLAIWGQYTGTTYGPVTILSNIIYVSEREDGQTIEDDVLRGLFNEIYDIAEDEEMLLKNAPDDFSGEAAFYLDMHDNLKERVIYPVLHHYVQEEEGIDKFIEQCVRVDELATALRWELLSNCFGRWFVHYLGNVVVGFIRTVAFVHPVVNIMAILGYFILIGMGTYCYWKDKESKAVQLFLLTMLLTVGTVAAVSMTIMCLSRYMIYNTAMIYITAFLLLCEAVRGKAAQEKR